MTTALIGYTGFVGSNLLRQGHYDLLYCSDNIEEIRHTRHDRIVCAGAPGTKWSANEHPDDDLASIDRLARSLDQCFAKQFTLISTVDVRSKSAYGKHRRFLEDKVRWMPPPSEPRRFDHVTVVRLPALFGPGLKKNVLSDLMHKRRLKKINELSLYQWYPIRRLSDDLKIIEDSGVEVVTISTEAMFTWRIAQKFFPELEIGSDHPDRRVRHLFESDHAHLWGRKDHIMTIDEILAEMALFLEEERNGRTDQQGVLATAHEGPRA